MSSPQADLANLKQPKSIRYTEQNYLLGGGIIG
jgi:hypothetical protein